MGDHRLRGSGPGVVVSAPTGMWGPVPVCHVKNRTIRASQTAAPFRGLCREPPGLQTPSDGATAPPSVLQLEQKPRVQLTHCFTIKEVSCLFTGVF